MGKKTKKEKAAIGLRLEILMNLASDIAYRNPRLKAIHQKYPTHFVDKALDPSSSAISKELDKFFKEIYGEVFPSFPFPAMRLDNYEKDPSELVLRIDLNYTKDEIMHSLEGFVSAAYVKYRKNRTIKFERRDPQKWQTYLEIWDLKNGDPPWHDFGGGFKGPLYHHKGKKRPWTYEEIAKYLYPDSKTPEQLNKAVNKIKKQYRAAYKLICGEAYNAQKREKLLSSLREKSEGEFLCDKCPDRKICDTECPRLAEDLSRLEIKQQHLLVSNAKITNLEKIKSSKKKPTADKQFK